MATTEHVSRHGIVTQITTDTVDFHDGSAMYVDNLLDCFESYGGGGSLKDHCVKLFRQEWTLLRSAGLSGVVPMDGLFKQHLTMRKKMVELVELQPEDGLIEMSELWRKDAATTVKRMLEAAHKNDRINIVATDSAP